MKIQSFRIRKFRNIEDSKEIELLDNLTCIVGKNQSGKTALLRALHKFNPHTIDPYDMRSEWPRGQRTSRNPKQIVCEVRFKLIDSEKEKLKTLTDKLMTAEEVVISKDYEGNFEFNFPDQPDLFPDSLHPNNIDKICNELTLPSDPVGSQFKTAAEECVKEVRRLSHEGRFDELLQVMERQIQDLNSTLSQEGPQKQNESQYIQAYRKKLQEIGRNLGAELTMHQQAHDYLITQIPTFIYMEDYRSFRGEANLVELQQKLLKNTKLNGEEETFLMILNLAGLKLDVLINQGASNNQKILHDRQIDLQDGATTLTNNVAGRWGQNEYKIEFRVDSQTFFTDIEEIEKNIGMIPLSEQSKGFQWFFSFDLHFMHESNGTFKGYILLLDEPGLHLHPGGQEDLLKRLDAYAEDNLLIYTTHLPFLIDLREPGRIKVINQSENGAEVSEDLGASQKEEKLTLQAALGMRANQSYLVAQRNLVVEGIDDYWILAELSNIMYRSNESGLPDDVLITAAGSASDVVHTTTFMIGQELGVLALFDSDSAGRLEEAKLRTKWITRYKDVRSRTLLLGDAVEAKGDFTIEDMFPQDYYLEKVRNTHSNKLKGVGKTEDDLEITGSGPILPRVEEACKKLGIQFNKGSVAKFIKHDLIKMGNKDKLPNGTFEKALKLMKAINGFFQDE